MPAPVGTPENPCESCMKEKVKMDKYFKRSWTKVSFPGYDELESYGVNCLSLESYNRVKNKLLDTPMPVQPSCAENIIDLDSGVPWHHEYVANCIEYDL
jgi:hypothetical protein